MINLIVCKDQNGGIGYQGRLIKMIREDITMFKYLTYGCIVLMGRKTAESLPCGPLPGRSNIVISSQPCDDLREKGFIVMPGVYMDLLVSGAFKDAVIWVIGGASIYNQMLDKCDKLWVSTFESTAKADAFFPEIPPYFNPLMVGTFKEHILTVYSNTRKHQ